jgi:hypothetical protein
MGRVQYIAHMKKTGNAYKILIRNLNGKFNIAQIGKLERLYENQSWNVCEDASRLN